MIDQNESIGKKNEFRIKSITKYRDDKLQKKTIQLTVVDNSVKVTFQNRIIMIS